MASRRKKPATEAGSEKPLAAGPEPEKQPETPPAVSPLDIGTSIALGLVRSYLESHANEALEFGLSAAVVGAKKLGLSLADVKKRTAELWENEGKLKL